MAPGSSNKGKNNGTSYTITLNPSVKLPLPIFGSKAKTTEVSSEKTQISNKTGETKENEKKSHNQCFNSHCTISKINYKYYNLQHLKGIFKKHVKTCKQ